MLIAARMSPLYWQCSPGVHSQHELACAIYISNVRVAAAVLVLLVPLFMGQGRF